MKDFFIKYWSLLIIGSATIIFCLATIMQNIFNMELKDSFSIVIAFIGIFATFGGAYVGAKISGDNAIKISKNQMIMEDLKNKQTENKKSIEKFEKVANFTNNVEKIENISQVIEYNIAIDLLRRELTRLILTDKDKLSSIVYYPYYIYSNHLQELEKLLDNYYTKSEENYEKIIKKEIKCKEKSLLESNNDFYIEDIKYDDFSSIFSNQNYQNINEVECNYKIFESKRELKKNHINYNKKHVINYNNEYVIEESKENSSAHENFQDEWLFMVDSNYEKNNKNNKNNDDKKIDHKTLKINIDRFNEIYNLSIDDEKNFTIVLEQIKKSYKNIPFKTIRDYNEFIFNQYKL